MNKRSSIMAIAFVVVAIILIWWRFGPRENAGPKKSLRPELSVAAVSIDDIDDERIKMSAKILLSNPLPIELKTKGLTYEVLVNGKKVVESSYTKPIVVKSNDSASISMPMEILAKPLMKVLKELSEEKADSADYTLRATLLLDIPIAGNREFDIHETKRLPSFRLPKVVAHDIDVKKIRLKDSKLKMEIEVNNPNTFPFKMRDVDYNVKVGNDLALEGAIQGFTNIPAKSTVTIPVDLEIQNKNMLKLISKTLFKDETSFTVDFRCLLVSKNDMFNNSRMAMRTEGTLGELKDAVKHAQQIKRQDRN